MVVQRWFQVRRPLLWIAGARLWGPLGCVGCSLSLEAFDVRYTTAHGPDGSTSDASCSGDVCRADEAGGVGACMGTPCDTSTSDGSPDGQQPAGDVISPCATGGCRDTATTDAACSGSSCLDGSGADASCAEDGSCSDARAPCAHLGSACGIATWDSTASECVVRRLADCTPCDGADGVCVSGVCRPDGIVFFDDFEREALGEPWKPGGDGGWHIEPDSEDERLSGMRSAASGPTPDFGRSSLALSVPDVPAGADVSFLVRVESETNTDWLGFNLNGELQITTWSGRVLSDRSVTRIDTSGTLELEWVYIKDSMVSVGRDRAWIDAVQIRLDCGSTVPSP